jgi:hypothetical protein
MLCILLSNGLLQGAKQAATTHKCISSAGQEIKPSCLRRHALLRISYACRVRLH